MGRVRARIVFWQEGAHFHIEFEGQRVVPESVGKGHE